MKKTSPLFRFDRLLIAALALLATPQVHAQTNIWTNPITGTNPNTDNPYVTGNVVASNLTVSGIGRGSGISGSNANNRYNANDWTTSASIDLNDYFYFTLTPASGYEIDFNGFVYTCQASSGTPSFAFRSSVDNYASNIGTPNANGTTNSLSGASFQNITNAITFRFYGFGFTASTTTYSVDDFYFTGNVNQLVSGALNWAGGSGNWDTGFGGTVTNGSALSFSGSGGIATNNLVALLIASMTFSNGTGSYTVAGDAFTISNGIVNNSANAQVFSNAITLGAAQTFNAASGALTFAGNITNGDNLLTLTVASNATVSGIVSGDGGLTKSGAGTVTLSGASANTFTGTTTVSAGTLQLNKTAGVTALSSTNLIVSKVDNGNRAVLLLSANDQVSDTTAVTLSGGTIRRGGDVSEIFGSLNLTEASFLDYGADNAIGISNGFTTGTEGGYFTITAIPEPSTYLAAAGLLSLMLWPSRKRLIKDAKKILGLTPPMRDRLARRAS